LPFTLSIKRFITHDANSPPATPAINPLKGRDAFCSAIREPLLEFVLTLVEEMPSRGRLVISKRDLGFSKGDRQPTPWLSVDAGFTACCNGETHLFFFENEQIFIGIFVDMPISACENRAIIRGTPGDISR
jgi:hypothetical protein